MLTRREDKYTSAPPRCTCLPTRQHRTEVALGGEQVHLGQVEVQLGFASLNFNLASMYLFSSSCNFSLRPPRPSPSSTRLRLVELGLRLGGLEWSQRWSTSCNFSQVHLGQVGLDGLYWSLWWITSCNSTQVQFGQVQVQLGFASLNLNLTSLNLRPSR